MTLLAPTPRSSARSEGAEYDRSAYRDRPHYPREPHINGPLHPDLATPISECSPRLPRLNNWPDGRESRSKWRGSCTQLVIRGRCRALRPCPAMLPQPRNQGRSLFAVTLLLEQIRATIARDGRLALFEGRWCRLGQRLRSLHCNGTARTSRRAKANSIFFVQP